MPELVLASSSPRRKDMIDGLGLSYIIDKPEIDETPLKGELPKAYVERIAIEKAKVVAERQKGKVVLAADTTVAVGRIILGKPEGYADAVRMLKLMSGRRHHILTTACVIDAQGDVKYITTKSIAKMKPLSESDIKRHLSDESNWADKAGAYGIQTISGGTLVKEIQGSLTGIIGLPLVETMNLLRRCGFGV